MIYTVSIIKARAPWMNDSLKMIMKQRAKAKASTSCWNRTNHTAQKIFQIFQQTCENIQDHKTFWTELETLHSYLKQLSSWNTPSKICTNIINNCFVANIPGNIRTDSDIIQYYENRALCNEEFNFRLVTEAENMFL